MMWRVDPLLIAARKMAGWNEFQKACASANLFFDHIERVNGKRGEFKAVAFTLERRRDHAVTYHIADGHGRSPIDALESAYRAALEKGYDPADADRWLEMLRNPPRAAAPPVVASDFDDLLGGDSIEEIEDLLG